MPEHVLVPIDGSDHAFAGLEYSLGSFPDATIDVLYVVDPSHDHVASVGSRESVEARAEQRGERVLDRAVEYAEERDRQIGSFLREGAPHTEILESTSTDVDHVVIGSHGESPLRRPFLGHVSEAVVRRAPVTTTVVPEPVEAIRERELPGSVLVPLDGSEQAEAALEFALETFPDGDVTAFHALSLPFDRDRTGVRGTYLEEIVRVRNDRADAVFEDAREIADDHGADVRTDTDDADPATAIVERVETDDYDQIVMGSHGRSLAARLITGTVAERVARRSPRAVTLVRGAN
ncbi:universal stress protein [Natrarchaeobius oligotrophus]|uniref:Universal stress protein n=1 Tax=Natrarchaeobius chitinivorans TaxID=1679083 RepID=A0A3N6MWX8_NATCH|nr:universal stress protein [Natrarchaeobius chitinivorans]RQH02511.1 universal stress protein [Natrarchaeobius chitinivorans]